MKPACEELLHPALEPAGCPGAAGTAPLAEARLSDRGRVGVLLQAGSLLSHLGVAGWRLDNGWERATVDSAGILRGVGAVPGAGHQRPQRALADLSATLFRADRGIAGRGEARRIARSLHASWSTGWSGASADRAVGQVLDQADFLWRSEFGGVRATLAGVHVWGRERRLWVAGPSWFRRPLLAQAGSRRELEHRLSSLDLRPLWRRPAAGEPGEEVPGGGEAEDLLRAGTLYSSGRFEAAIAILAGVGSARAAILRARCLLWLGRLPAAGREVGKLAAIDLSGEAVLEAARVGVEVGIARGDEAAARSWVERALASASAAPPARSWSRPEAHLLAAEAAAARGDHKELLLRLRSSRVVLEEPSLAWRWNRVAGRAALARGRAEVAVACLGRALGARRRLLPSFLAGLLWGELSVGRRIAGDLAGAERAANHAARLHSESGEPPRTAGAYCRLAQTQLRRGRLVTAVDLLEHAGGWRVGRRSERRALAARRELVRGRPEAALGALRAEGASAAGRELRGEGAALAARALGWLGCPDRAARALAASGGLRPGWFEFEEIPALWALAGRRRRALVEARGATAGLWTALLSGAEPAASDWAALDGLGDFRRARLVYDAELCVPGSCPPARVERAIAELERQDAGSFAARLGAADRSVWRALSVFLRQGEPGRAGLTALFASAGAAGARLSLERRESRTVLLDGPGGETRIEEPVGGARLVLRVPAAGSRLRALLRVVASRLSPEPVVPVPGRGGMVGESESLLEALARAAAFAPTELPVLVQGETGTGKDLLSRHIHASSHRAEGPFVPLNCAGVARELLLSDLFGHVRGAFTSADRDRAGVFEAARGGTVFLDEIGDLPLSAQGALLRVLQEGEVRRVGESVARRVDTRVVAATHRDLESMVKRGQFRQDLFFRLRAASVALPALRDRGRDVLLLARHFLRRLRPEVDLPLSRSARERILAHSWPGNVRELENVLAVAVAMSGGAVEAEHLELPRADRDDGLGYHARVSNYRRRLIEEALAASGGRQAAAARRLGVSRQALSYLVRSLGIQG